MKRSLSFEVWIRRALGVAVIMGVVAIAIGWDTNLLTKFSIELIASFANGPKPLVVLGEI
jgi:hypothetical protein